MRGRTRANDGRGGERGRPRKEPHPRTERPHGRRAGTRGKPTGITPPHHSWGAVPPRLRLRVGPKPTETREPGERPRRTGEDQELTASPPQTLERARPRDSSSVTRGKRPTAAPQKAGTPEREVKTRRTQIPRSRGGTGHRSSSARGNAAGARRKRGDSDHNTARATHTRDTHGASASRERQRRGRTGGAARGGARHGAHERGRCAVSQETAKNHPSILASRSDPPGGRGGGMGERAPHRAVALRPPPRDIKPRAPQARSEPRVPSPNSGAGRRGPRWTRESALVHGHRGGAPGQGCTQTSGRGGEVGLSEAPHGRGSP